jgi:cellobiose-specific phosphotransferase system component IIB
MLNLLPQEEKNKMIKEYNLRLSITIVSFLCILLIIALVGLFPSYVNQRSEMNNLEKQKAEAEQKNSEASIEEAAKLSISNKVLVDYLDVRIVGMSATYPAGKIVEDVFAKKNEGIQIEAIEIVDKQVTIKGKAATRSGLISFHSTLRTQKEFKNASLPIDNIARSVDAPFVIQIALP